MKPTIRDLSKARIVVVGDAMIDVWVHGRVDRISPEAPVPVFVEERREDTFGGAANVMANLRALGCVVDYPFTVKSALKTRYVVNHQQIFRADDEDCSPISEEDQNRLFERDTANPCDVLIISDYNKGVCTPSLCQRLIKWAKERGILTIVDPKGDDWRKIDGCDVITPNSHEAASVRWANGPHGLGIVMTCGANGIIVTHSGGDQVHIPATGPKVVDVCGAGDTVVAVLAAALAIGADLETAARWANCAAGIVVGKHQTATVTLDELEAAWASQ